MSDLREHGKLVRQFLKAARELESLNVVDGLENMTLGQLREELTRRSSPGAGYKQQYPRHGVKWDEEEKQRLIALAEAGMLDVEEFAREYQRRPESVLAYMVRLGLLDKDHDLR
ncbi:hypothetical protein L8O47_22690 [Enterobacter roggenkampii]|uniref:hypothetical protein n=1 Tax=Enterobacteriaceae TaxID=543 RepID=UPI0018AA74C7|nr:MULTISPECIES: hypothetical protein [Enterobacteriaceae]HAS1070082.1 cob(I)yrinic acid a,c-diamide adenosyltransferase [Enterobacter cloacae]HAY7230787.1 cob(I)yrinic acid a,c-diamide adenosyltransferase [Shigella sonnei]MBF9065643.1 hypothetical protein [Escherichia coli]MCK7015575.1 hypothetical protein [Enterobacter roggenkampii]MCK7028885.1 hypothetical protein [Enterobacter roggenkampii]